MIDPGQYPGADCPLTVNLVVVKQHSAVESVGGIYHKSNSVKSQVTNYNYHHF